MIAFLFGVLERDMLALKTLDGFLWLCDVLERFWLLLGYSLITQAFWKITRDRLGVGTRFRFHGRSILSSKRRLD